MICIIVVVVVDSSVNRWKSTSLYHTYKRLHLLWLVLLACQWCSAWYCTYDNMRPQSGHVAGYLIADSPDSSCHYGNLAILSGHHWQRHKRTHRYQGQCNLIRKLLQDRPLFRDMTWEILVVRPVDGLWHSDGPMVLCNMFPLPLKRMLYLTVLLSCL